MDLIRVENLRKSYGGAFALRGASFTLRAGETHALMGENGAGKSTLIKILAGATLADSGEIHLNGAPARATSPGDAHRLGLRFIHQELNIVPALSVAENIFLGRPYPRRFGLVNWRLLNARARQALAALEVAHISPRATLASLPVGDRMLVKIAAAFLDDDARIFVMDEPTAALTSQESERLFAVVRRLRAQGCGVVYVSHRLDEVLDLADRITVLRDGETAATLTRAEANKQKLIGLMTGGREIAGLSATTAARPEIALAVERLSAEGLQDVSFTLRRGEILGVAGLAGSGAERLTKALLAAPPLRSPAEAWRQGVALLPRERRAQGLWLGESITKNIALPHLSGLWLKRRAERARAVETGARVRLKASGPQQKVRALSGGNQQKVMFARAVAGSPAVLLLDEPTRGVDVGAKFDIYALLAELAAAGTAILVSSSDQEELLHICSRLIVLREGRVAASVPAQGLTPQSLLALCYGEA